MQDKLTKLMHATCDKVQWSLRSWQERGLKRRPRSWRGQRNQESNMHMAVDLVTAWKHAIATLTILFVWCWTLTSLPSAFTVFNPQFTVLVRVCIQAFWKDQLDSNPIGRHRHALQVVWRFFKIKTKILTQNEKLHFAKKGGLPQYVRNYMEIKACLSKIKRYL